MTPQPNRCGAPLKNAGFCSRKVAAGARCHQHRNANAPAPATPPSVVASVQNRPDQVAADIQTIARRMDERAGLVTEAVQLQVEWLRMKVTMAASLDRVLNGAAWMLTYRPLALGLAMFLVGVGANLSGADLAELPIWKWLGSP